MFVVTVLFHIRRDRIAAFLPLMQAQARASLGAEPGCQVFDVCQSAEDPARVFLYEVYCDRAAFDVHLASTHFRAFDTAVSKMVAAKEVATYQRLDPAQAGMAQG